MVLTFLSGLIVILMEQLILDVTSKQLEEKKVIRSNQPGFINGKSCLTNMVDFCDVVTSWVDEERAVNVAHLNFSKTFEATSHNMRVWDRQEDSEVD